MRTRIGTLTALAAALVALPACNNPVYFEGFEQLVIDGSVETEHPQIGAWVQTEYWLDFAAPTAAELEELQPAGSEPADMIPWVQRGAYDFSVQWRLENTSDEEIEAWVTLDGATEFFDWNPIAMYGIGGGEDAEELPFPSLLGFTPRHLAPGEVVQGEFREDDTIEAALDLDVLTRFCGGPFAVIHNRSEVSDAGMSAFPADAAVAGFVLVRLTLAADGPATLDYSIRVRDDDDVLFDAANDDARYEVEPEPYVPAGIATVPAGADDPSTTSAYCMTGDDMG